MKPEIILIKDREFEGYFSAAIEINGTVFQSVAVQKKELWEKNFKIKKS